MRILVLMLGFLMGVLTGFPFVLLAQDRAIVIVPWSIVVTANHGDLREGAQMLVEDAFAR